MCRCQTPRRIYVVYQKTTCRWFTFLCFITCISVSEQSRFSVLYKMLLTTYYLLEVSKELPSSLYCTESTMISNESPSSLRFTESIMIWSIDCSLWPIFKWYQKAFLINWSFVISYLIQNELMHVFQPSSKDRKPPKDIIMVSTESFRHLCHILQIPNNQIKTDGARMVTRTW